MAYSLILKIKHALPVGDSSAAASKVVKLHVHVLINFGVVPGYYRLNGIRLAPQANREFSFSTIDGPATVMMTFGGFEDGHPSISTTVLGMKLRCAENDVWLKKTVADPSVVENVKSLIFNIFPSEFNRRHLC